LGVISVLIGIIKGIIDIIKAYKENVKPKISKNSLILFLFGIIMTLIGVLVVDKLIKCNHPYIKISEYSKNDSPSNYYTIEGHAKCFPADFKIALLIHRLSQPNTLEGWFINGECAHINNKNKWRLTNVEIGTANTKGYIYEIYAYAIPDSICVKIGKIVNNQDYQGSIIRPTIFQGVFDMLEIRMN
jgi:hypothetical protein